MAKNPLSQVELPNGTVMDVKDNTIVAGDNITITTNSDGERVISAAGGGSGITRISDKYDIYIWDLDPGIYILDAPYDANNPFKYIHYYGKNTSSSYRIAIGRGAGEVMLFVTCSRPGAIESSTITFKTWYTIYMAANQTTASSPIMYWGYTTGSSGTAKACNLDAMVRGSSGTTTTTAGKVLLSTSSAGMITYSNWSTAGFLKTNASGVVSIDSNSYGQKLYEYRDIAIANRTIRYGNTNRTASIRISFLANVASITCSTTNPLDLHLCGGDEDADAEPYAVVRNNSSIKISRVSIRYFFSIPTSGGTDYYNFVPLGFHSQYSEEEDPDTGDISEWTDVYMFYITENGGTTSILSEYMTTDTDILSKTSGTITGTAIN